MEGYRKRNAKMGPDRAHIGPPVRLSPPGLPELFRNFGIETAYFRGYSAVGVFRWGTQVE